MRQEEVKPEAAWFTICATGLPGVRSSPAKYSSGLKSELHFSREVSFGQLPIARLD
jgi:hypothetical protein